MGINVETGEPWASFAVRLPPELAREVEQFAEDIGEDVMSNAIRILIAAGLEQKKRGKVHEDRVIIANAKATAINRLATLTSAIIEEFRDMPLKEPDEEDDGLEEDEEVIE
jgi:hypothetical protein